MGTRHEHWPGRAFWDGYRTVLGAARIKPEKAKWYFLRVEQYFKAHPSVALSAHEADHVQHWFEQKRRAGYLTRRSARSTPLTTLATEIPLQT